MPNRKVKGNLWTPILRRRYVGLMFRAHLPRIAKNLPLVACLLLSTSCNSLQPHSGILEDNRSLLTSRNEPGQFAWVDGLSSASALTPDNAVALGLMNNPDFQAALADLGISKADIVKAGELTNPSLGLLLPHNTSALEFTAKLPVEVLWLRPKRIKAAKLDADAVALKLTQGGVDLARDVRLGCHAVELARAKQSRAKESTAIFQQISQLASAQFRAGETGELEASQAAADALVAHQEELRLQYEYELALQQLRGLLGLSASKENITLKPLPAPRQQAPAPVSRLVEEALLHRPDVRAAEMAVEAAATKAKLAPAEMVAISTGLKTTEGSGTQASFDVTLPLLNQNQSGRALANAQLGKTIRLLNAARNRAATEIRRAHLQVKAAQEVMAGWTRIMPELDNSLKLAMRSVELGNNPQLATLDSARRLADARSKYAESEARLRDAWAELDRAGGRVR